MQSDTIRPPGRYRHHPARGVGAWTILGQTLVGRTADSDTEQRAALGGLWGSEQTQSPATFQLDRDATAVTGKTRTVVTSSTDLAPERTDVRVGLALDQRQKGLLWYNTYVVGFDGYYNVRNDGSAARLRIVLPFASQQATYDDVFVSLNGRPLATRPTTTPCLPAPRCKPGRPRSSESRTARTASGRGPTASPEASPTFVTSA